MNNNQINKIYHYREADGKPLFQVVRSEHKKFRQRRPFRDGFAWGILEGWYKKDIYGDDYFRIKNASADKKSPPNIPAVWFDAVEPVLYRLPELLEGVQAKKMIFVCEGEKDADNLASLGFVSTTCPMGAGKWESSYTETLKECLEAIIIADKDEPGRKHAEAVADELCLSRIPVKVLEMPDIGDTPVKDISDWLAAGGTKEEFDEFVQSCPAWSSLAQKATPIGTQEDSQPMQYEALVTKYGEPYYLGRGSAIKAVNQPFWAGLHQTENIQLFEPDERVFYRYNPENGLYSIISEDVIKQEIASRILEVSRERSLPTLEHKRTNSDLNNIVAQLKGISEKKNAFSRDKKIVHLANGVIEFNDNGENNFYDFSPLFCSRNQCPMVFDPSARCERFLNELLLPAVSKEDAVLIQKYAGLCLLGNNLVQRFLILDGMPGRGKSTLALIIQKLAGRENVTELRTKHLDERFELFRYRKKNLLVGVDVPGWFLSTKGANTIKKLVGGDELNAEQKGGNANFPFQGSFCILITSNSRLQVHLDGDTGAWKRRLLITRFEAPAPAKKIPDFADLLIREEGSGILNWALQGLGMLLRDVHDLGDIRMTENQEKVIDRLLAESDSLRKFLSDKVIKHEKMDVSVDELITAYSEYCATMGWNPKPITIIHRELGGLMLELFQTAKSGSIWRERKYAKGFRGVMIDNENGNRSHRKDSDEAPWE